MAGQARHRAVHQGSHIFLRVARRVQELLGFSVASETADVRIGLGDLDRLLVQPRRIAPDVAQAGELGLEGAPEAVVGVAGVALVLANIAILNCVAASVSLFTLWRSWTNGAMAWQEPQADTVAVLSRPCAKDRKATIRGTRPMPTKSQPRAGGATLAGRRLLQAKTRSTRFMSAKAIPRPRNQSLVVPIQPRGNGTDRPA